MFAEVRYLPLILMVFLKIAMVDVAYSGQDDSDYRDYILQRIRIAQIKTYQGGQAEKENLGLLIREALQKGVNLPHWVDTGSGKKVCANSYHDFRKARAEQYDNIIIEAICREAGMRAMREEHEEGKTVEAVAARHFESALKDVHASTTKEMLERFKKLDQDLRRATETDPAATSMYG